ncbi:MAG: hypothetical protein ACYSU8_09185 [Planctomycetota bacterium]|jgi:hypothetical protein
MNAFIEKNMKLLKFFHAALRLSGWLSLALGLFSPIVLIVVAKNSDPQMMRDILLYSPLKHLVIFAFKLFYFIVPWPICDWVGPIDSTSI